MGVDPLHHRSRRDGGHVSVGANPAAHGTLHRDDSHFDLRIPLPDDYRETPIGISLRRTDREACAAPFRIVELAIGGDLPIAILPFPPQISLADPCRDGEPCPPP